MSNKETEELVKKLQKDFEDKDAYIARLEQRIANLGGVPPNRYFYELNPDPSLLSREDLEVLNKNISPSRTKKAFNPDKIKMPDHEEQVKILTRQAVDNQEKALQSIVSSITFGVDMEKHGIDRETLAFKPGYGPNGLIVPPRVTFFQKVKQFFKGNGEALK